MLERLEQTGFCPQHMSQPLSLYDPGQWYQNTKFWSKQEQPPLIQNFFWLIYFYDQWPITSTNYWYAMTLVWSTQIIKYQIKFMFRWNHEMICSCWWIMTPTYEALQQSWMTLITIIVDQVYKFECRPTRTDRLILSFSDILGQLMGYNMLNISSVTGQCPSWSDSFSESSF